MGVAPEDDYASARNLAAQPTPQGADLADALEQQDVKALFPIRSQTTLGDRKFLMSIIALMRQKCAAYSYLEVGSFMGGSLAPFLLDDKCAAILSVDDRGKIQNDERGLKFDYTPFSTDAMLQNLTEAGLDTQKLSCFDGDISDYDGPAGFDLIHIDAIHTDEAVFRDFLACKPMLKRSSVVLFHDYDLVFRGVEMVRFLLESEGIPYSVALKEGSLFCAIFLGDFVAHADQIGESSEKARTDRMRRALKARVLDQFKNRSYVPVDGELQKFDVPDTVVIVDEETRVIPNG